MRSHVMTPFVMLVSSYLVRHAIIVNGQSIIYDGDSVESRRSP